MKTVLALLIIMSTFGFSEPIKVRVVGISNDIADGTQKDRHEAIIDAKRNAIEQAGINIQSKTTMENFMVNSDKIETLAEAVLLPGFEIVDVGYDDKEVTYKVVLIGEIQSSENSKSTKVLYRSKQGCRQDFRIISKNKILEERLACDEEHLVEISTFDNLVILSPAETGLTSRWIEVALPLKSQIKNGTLIIKGTEIQRIKAAYTKEGLTEKLEGDKLVKTYSHKDTLNYFDGKEINTIVPSTELKIMGQVVDGDFVCESSTRSFFLDAKVIKTESLSAPCDWPKRGEFEYKGELKDSSVLMMKTRRNNEDWYWSYDIENKVVDDLYKITDFVE